MHFCNPDFFFLSHHFIMLFILSIASALSPPLSSCPIFSSCIVSLPLHLLLISFSLCIVSPFYLAFLIISSFSFTVTYLSYIYFLIITILCVIKHDFCRSDLCISEGPSINYLQLILFSFMSIPDLHVCLRACMHIHFVCVYVRFYKFQNQKKGEMAIRYLMFLLLLLVLFYLLPFSCCESPLLVVLSYPLFILVCSLSPFFLFRMLFPFSSSFAPYLPFFLF